MENGFQLDPIQSRIEESADQLFRHIKRAKLCLVHFLGGSDRVPGAIRKSTIRTRNGILLEQFCQNLDGDALPDAERSKRHRDVLDSHIKAFDRENTLLSVIEDSFRTAMINAPRLDSLNVFLAPDSTRAWCDFETPSLSPDGTSAHLSWLYSRNITQILIPSISENYMKHLYHVGELADEAKRHIRSAFELARCHAFGLSMSKNHDPIGIAKTVPLEEEALERYIASHRNKWRHLCALQSVLFYLQFGDDTMTLAPEATAIFIRPGSWAEETIPFAVAVFTPRLDVQEMEVAKNGLRSFLSHACDMVNLTGNLSVAERKKLIPVTNFENPTIKPSFLDHPKISQADAFETTMKDVFKFHLQKQRLKVISLWFLKVLEYLHGAVHEGSPLDFFLIAGDLSDFKDHHRTDFKTLSNEVEAFEIPESNDLEVVDKAARRAAKMLAKEHFPWFERGKHAMLWDVTGGSLAPCGLVSISHSSWEYVIAERFREHQSVDIPVCVVAFSVGVRGEAGTVILKGKGQAVDEVTRFRDKYWAKISDKRQGFLKFLLKDKLGLDEDDLISEAIDLTLAVADNPETGGTILISKNRDLSQVFPHMGEPWVFEDMSREDRVALIAHDGASSIRISKPSNWGHRLLMLADDIHKQVRNELVAATRAHEKDFPLTGTGSRRWSSGFIAFHKEVSAVLVISQDGDIQCWISPPGPNRHIDGAEIVKIPQSGNPSRYNGTMMVEVQYDVGENKIVKVK